MNDPVATHALDAMLKAADELRADGGASILEYLSDRAVQVELRHRWRGTQEELRSALARVAEYTARRVMRPAND